MKTIAITGARGFIGRWFIEKYKHKYKIIAISRRKVVAHDDDQVEWRQADLYSLSSTVRALSGADYALYLVHSMMPSSRLNQASFEDTDLLLADNFARAAEQLNLEQLVYVGGLLPKSNDLSPHLRSRYEVEQTLASRKTPLTALRAGLIVGPGGSSFTIVEKLVRRLPIMGCPSWTLTKSQPIGLRDVLQILDHCLGNPKAFHETIDIGGDDILPYREMLQITARVMKLKRWIFPFPIFSIGLSKAWVGLFSDSSLTFVSPLVESLKHEMLAEPHPVIQELSLTYQTFEEAVHEAVYEKDTIPQLPKSQRSDEGLARKQKNTVRSVQRLTNPNQKGAVWVGDRYVAWLPSFMRYVIRAQVDEQNNVSFFLIGVNQALLKLSFKEDSSAMDRQLFMIDGGALVEKNGSGWLEFREVLQGRYVMAAIHDFVPQLPWYLYRLTQAQLHLWVMKSFQKYLNKYLEG